MNGRIYLDNAATTFPKPEEVYQAQDAYFRKAANPGRSAHGPAVESARTLFEVRLEAADFLGISDPSRLVFTAGCTASINAALKGLPLSSGDVVLTSALEHNSVMRPLRQLQNSLGIQVKQLPYAEAGIIDPEQLNAALAQFRPRLCVFAEASNVTGEVIDLPSIASACNLQQVPLMIDAAQSAGHVPQRIDELGISLWCASGHKGLLGAPGCGLLYISPRLNIEPLIAGGTGSGSENLEMPAFYPDRLEAGTTAGPAIAALGAGVKWLKVQGIENLEARARNLTERFIQGSRSVPGLRLYGSLRSKRTGIAAFALSNVTPDVVADKLDAGFGIAVRAGLHCAAAAHKSLGSLDTGLVRMSVGCFNQDSDIEAIIEALHQIARL